MGTAYFISILKKISITGMLLPAPDSPPAFDTIIKKNMRIRPDTNMTGLFSKAT
jgi:hypothetical protein